jgi:hypothetical protein
VQDTPIVNYKNVARLPFMNMRCAAGQPILDQTERCAPARVDGFEAAGIVPKEGALMAKKLNL